MDFNFTEEQNMVRDLARGILDKEVSHERLKKVEADPDWFDRPLWATLAEAGLLGIVVPEELGGMGFGFLELCSLLQEIGRAVAPVPVFPALALGALPLREFGTDAQKEQWLTPVTAGEVILSAALGRTGDSPWGVRAREDGGGWILDGRSELVPTVHLAQRVLVPAAVGPDTGLFLVDPRTAGVSLTRHRTSRGEPLFRMEFISVRLGPEDLVGENVDSGEDRISWITDHALVATCATQVGVSERALEMTADYAREREQFGVPIGTFQAVQHRTADCYIDLNAMRWVTWRAAWKLSRRLPARREVAVAKFWAAEGGSRIANAAQHLHGGIGVDLDYPLHRYFLWTKALELRLGGAAEQLGRLGRDMAHTGPESEVT